jgi:hypothetical protein
VHAGGDQASLTKVAIFGALRLYMDFINLMIVMLKFFGERRELVFVGNAINIFGEKP